MCGTIRSNCRGFPNGLSPQKADVKPLQKGESKFYHYGNLVASVWKDKTSLLSKHPVKSSWRPNSQQKTT